jgi:hypothetical protein
MAEADTPSSTSEQAAGEQEPVVKPLSIEIKQGRTTGLVRTLMSTASELWMGIERVRRRRKPQRPWRKRWRPQRDPVLDVAKNVWPPDGEPPPDMPTPHVLQKLGKVCKDRGITTSDDTLRRATGRR